MIAALKNIAPLVLYVIGIGVFIASITGKPRIGLYFLIPLLPLQNVIDKLRPFPMGKDFNDLMLIGILIGWIISKASKGEKFLIPSTYNAIFFCYLLFTYFTLWWGSFNIHAPLPTDITDPRVQNWKNAMVLPFLFFLSANNLNSKKEIQTLILLMLAGMVLMDFYNVKQIGLLTSWTSRAKINGTFSYLGANEVAAFYATNVLILIGLFLFDKRKRMKPFLAGLIAAAFYIILFMFSRGAYLAVLVGLFFLALVRVRILFIPIILVIVCWQFILPQSVIDRLQFTENEGELDASAATRLVLWEQSLIYFQQSPVVGAGFNVFGQLGMKSDTHNVFLRTLAEQGLIGIGLLLTILILGVKRGWRLYKIADDPYFQGLGLGFAACAIAVMVANFFGDRWSPIPVAAYYWCFLGMVEKSIYLKENETRSPLFFTKRGRGSFLGKNSKSPRPSFPKNSPDPS